MVMGLAACGPPEVALTARQLAAETPYDLGSEAVDVHFYPREQQENYKVFKERCSRCHTPARPLNFPAQTREEWTLFVSRMHEKSGKTLLSPVMEKQILDFLVYDSGQRKGSAAFQGKLAELRRLYERVEKERQVRSGR